MEQFTLTISKRIEQPNEIVTFYFDLGQYFPFKAGQFITLEVAVNNQLIRRSYSLQNSPIINEPWVISVKRVENGAVSRLLHDFYKQGDKITVYEPSGQFVFEPDETKRRDIFLCAAGSGITPIFSIIKTALQAEPHSRLILIYSNKSVEFALFMDELNTLQSQYPERFFIEYLFSNSKFLQKARLNRDLLEGFVKQYSLNHSSEALFYTCGPHEYMLMCRIVLLGLGYSPEQIKKETFVLPDDEADDDDETLMENEPKDTNTYTVVMQVADKNIQIGVPYPTTILEAALQSGLVLPYSCKAGMCGTCAANCLQGKVLMQYNEVLTDMEIEKGRILLCTARPLDNKAIIKL
jgi:ring-1,2-phenylacetyl-CoA epoxidase subunit PaaE